MLVPTLEAFTGNFTIGLFAGVHLIAKGVTLVVGLPPLMAG
ncbi:MAG: hypothetical protein ACJAYB_003513 [Psychromonas sp.]|jgi:hypothetical protein